MIDAPVVLVCAPAQVIGGPIARGFPDELYHFIDRTQAARQDPEQGEDPMHRPHMRRARSCHCLG